MANSGSGRRPEDDGGEVRGQPREVSSAEQRARERLERQRAAGGGRQGAASGRGRSGGRPVGTAQPGRGAKQAGRPATAGRGGPPPGRSQVRSNRPKPGRRRSGLTPTTKNAALFGSVFVVLAVVIIVLVATLGGSGKAAASVGKGYTPTAAPPSIVNGLANVSTGDLNEAGNGGDQVIFNSTSGPVYTVHGQKPLTSGGKPLVLYFGAEYCPFCAATRWPLVIALDKFGSFTGLQVTKSSPVDFSPNTPTLDFAKATYHSNYLSFSETEQLSNSCKHAVPNPSPPPKYACASLSDYPTVQNPSSFVKSIVTKYDSSPFVGQSAAGGIPFIDIGNRWVESGAPYPSSASQFPPISIDGLSWQQVVNTLQAPIAGSPGQAILGAANHYIAAFCELLGGKGPAICHASFVTAAEKTLS